MAKEVGERPLPSALVRRIYVESGTNPSEIRVPLWTFDGLVFWIPSFTTVVNDSHLGQHPAVSRSRMHNRQ